MNKITIGWREWVELPQLNIPAIKAKIDTGARTSALHAFDLEYFEEEGIGKVRFGIHPLQDNVDVEVRCVTDVVDERLVRDSGGHEEMRYVICTPVMIHEETWDIEITLTNREDMSFRMLLGRTAMRKRLVVDPEMSYTTGLGLELVYS